MKRKPALCVLNWSSLFYQNQNKSLLLCRKLHSVAFKLNAKGSMLIPISFIHSYIFLVCVIRLKLVYNVNFRGFWRNTRIKPYQGTDKKLMTNVQTDG